MEVSEPKESDFHPGNQQSILPPTRKMASQSVGTQTRAADFGTRLLKSFLRIFSRNKHRQSISTRETMSDSFKKRTRTPAKTETVSTETETTEQSKFRDFFRYIEKFFSRGKSKPPKDQVKPKVAEYDPGITYECCLDVSCVEPPPILPMDFFSRRRSTKGGIPMTATKSDLESATLLAFTMDNK